MKTYNPGVTTSILAAANLTKHRFVGFNGNVCGAGKKALGVPEVNFEAGEIAGLVCTGIMLVELGANVTDLDVPLTSDASGKAVPATVVSATVPTGATPVTSTSAQPEMTIAGGYLPQAINGYPMDLGSTGDLIRVLLA